MSANFRMSAELRSDLMLQKQVKMLSEEALMPVLVERHNAPLPLSWLIASIKAALR